MEPIHCTSPRKYLPKYTSCNFCFLSVMTLLINPNLPSLHLRAQVTNNKFIINKIPTLLNRIIYESCDHRGTGHSDPRHFFVSMTYIHYVNHSVQSDNMLSIVTLPYRAWALRAYLRAYSSSTPKSISSAALRSKHS